MSRKKTIYMTLGIVGCFLMIGIAFISIMINVKNFDRNSLGNTGSPSIGSDGEDYSKKVVNEPVEKDIVKLADGTDAHTFIGSKHAFYNNTLGYGNIETTTHSEQAEMAKEIVDTIDGVSTKNQDLADDFKEIKKYTTIAMKEDDQHAYIQLHRMFHDLDIYFNGYSYNQTWGVTEFTGE
ncbi:hypothetical protein [Peribacillus butanolivorans]|uniref:hypothetical protein n=3 Tax=Bacillaceae TaxID=186817 RepID=UPI0036704E7B